MKITSFEIYIDTISDNIIHQVVIHFEGSHNAYSGIIRIDYDEFHAWVITVKELARHKERDEDGNYQVLMDIIEQEVKCDESLQEDFLRWVL